MIIFRKFLRKVISNKIFNQNLKNKKFVKIKKLNVPFVSLVGPPRSGTTFFYNLIINNFDFDYYSNIEYLFYRYPFFSVRIGKFLKKFITLKKNYNSNYGLSSGLISPSENSLFWEDFAGFRDFKSTVSNEKLDIKTLRHIFNYRYKVNKKPILNKWTPLVFYTKKIDEIFIKNKLVGIIRNPYETANSILLARKKINNSYNEWWSFAPQGSEKFYNPYDQISFQVCSYLIKMRDLENKKKILIFSYEEIIKNPNIALLKLKKYFSDLNIKIKVYKDIDTHKNFLKPKKIPHKLSKSLKCMIQQYDLNNFLKKYNINT